MVSAIIVAAGKGVRMQSHQRKQYLPLADLPILVHTLKVFCTCDRISQIILVVPRDDFDHCRNHILDQIPASHNITLAAGGDRRQTSVYNGLQQVGSGCGIVVIHDGVRPLVSLAELDTCIDGARESGACILAVPAHDTLKQVDRSGRIVKTVTREMIWLAQTPQAFELELIRRAHRQARAEGFEGTDDASLVERLGETVVVHPGSRCNLKITDRTDLIMARALLDAETPQDARQY